MKILYVCEGNINRSQMAGTVHKALVPTDVVTTAGVYADYAGKKLSAVPQGSIESMRELGYDMSENVITQLTTQLVDDADKVVLMGAVPGGPIPEYLKASPKLETWDVPDPGYDQISVPGARDMTIAKVREMLQKDI